MLWAKNSQQMKRKKIQIVVSLGFAQLALSSATVFAQTQRPTDLNEVVVTASRSPKKQGDIGKVVRVITRDEIDKAQGRTLPELLNTVPGLNITGSGSNLGEVKSVYLRGASTANTLILIDGISVNDASGISREYNIAAIAVDQIERIEILKGASSTLYGSDAVAGVINIITRKGAGKLSANALLTGGTYNTFKQGLGLNGQIGETSLALNFSNLDSKGFSTANPKNNPINFDKDGFSQKSFGFNGSQKISEIIKITTGLQFNVNSADLDAGAFTDQKEYTYNKNAFLASLGANINLDKGNFNLIFSQNNVKNQFLNPFSLVNNKGGISNIEGILSYEFNSFLSLTSGANYKYSSTIQKNSFSNAVLNESNNITSIYTSFFLKGGEIFRMELGGRYNNHSQFGDNFTYTINPSINLKDQLKVYFNVSSAYRVPGLYQLYSIYANPDGLKPETSYTYEAGVVTDIIKEKLTFNTSVFKRRITDVIDFGLQANGGFGYLNQSEQNDNGFEVELGFKPTQKFNINAFYAFVDGKVRAKENAPEVFNLSRRPKNSLGANAGLSVSKNLYISLLYKWTDTRIDAYYDVNAGKAVEENLNSYHKVDTYIQYKPTQKLTLFADIKNIFDAEYNDFAGYNTMGANFNAGLSILFQ